MKSFLLLVMVCTVLYSDDVFTKNGVVYRNVTVIDSLDNYLRINTSDGTRRIPLLSILRIEKNIFGPEQKVVVENYTMQKDSIPDKLKPRVLYKYPNAKLWVVSATAFAVSYDLFSDANYIQDGIDKVLKILPNADVSAEENQRTRKRVIGGIILVAGVINLFYVFEKVEIRTDGQQFSLLYSF